MEWPSTLALEIFTLLDAIAKAPGEIHRCEAVDDDDGEKLTWAQFPYFGMIWHESTWADSQPGQICLQYVNSTLTLEHICTETLLEIQGHWSSVGREARLGDEQGYDPTYHSSARERKLTRATSSLLRMKLLVTIKASLTFHIPAVSFMFKYNGREVYDQVVTKGLGDWTKAQQLPEVARDFQNGAERWSFRRRCLEGLFRGNVDDEVKAAAQARFGYMSGSDH
jgi:hypothetical protein